MIQLKSFAKVNLGLEIISRNSSGYHLLKTIFQTINLYDTITIQETSSSEIKLRGSTKDIGWGADNTIRRTIDLVFRRFGLKRGFDIEVSKRIPAGSGLGGGSSNAAVVLLFLNDYFELNMSWEEMVELAAQIGADVPFFLLGGTALGEGIGEKLTPVDELTPQPISIVFPRQKVATRQIYSRFSLTSKAFESKISIFLKNRDLSILENDLEKTTFSLFPKIQQIKEEMKTLNFDLVLMSGSGSALFGLGRNADSDRLRQTCKTEVTVSETLNRDSYTSSIGVWPSGKASVFGADTRRFESSHPRK